MNDKKRVQLQGVTKYEPLVSYLSLRSDANENRQRHWQTDSRLVMSCLPQFTSNDGF